MLGSRRGRPSLIGRAAGTAARTALITKTATTVAGNSAAKQQAQMQAADLAHAERMAAAGGAAPAADAGLDGLRKLVAAHDSGVLTDAEFIAKVKERLA